MSKKVMKTMDGNTAAAYVSYAFSEVAGIYPITPSSTMAESADEWAAQGQTNMFGQTVKVVELQSEAGAAGTVHGSLQAGALTTTYTASQGLLLMIPNMYKIAGELLPCVIHVSARAVAGHALSIFGDHSDVMAVRQTGFAMLAGQNVQEAMHMAAVAHLATLQARVPFVHFFDGFRTSAEIQKIEVLDYDDLSKITDHNAIQEFRARALNPEHPVTRGTAQNPDIFFQAKEASNPFYNAVPEIVEKYMGEINKLTGKNYGLFNYYGPADADKIIIAMGSVCDTAEETVDYLNKKGEKVGVVAVHLYRPFSVKHLLNVIPKTVKKIAVLDRCKEPGSLGEPLYQDVCTAFFQAGGLAPEIFAGRYGLGSKDVTPAQIIAVYENLKQANPKNHFTVGIYDDVTNLSLPVGEEIDITSESTISCKFWGIGGDGTVGANKNTIQIIGDHTDLYTQYYAGYDSKKSMGISATYLRFGKEPIRSPYLIKTADFVACHVPSYLDKYDIVGEIKEGGKFLLNCPWSVEELDTHLPVAVKKGIASKNIQLYTIDATKIAGELGLGKHTNTVLQASFFKIALEHMFPIEEAAKYMKEMIHKSFARRGDEVLNKNYAAVDRGITDFVQVNVPEAWKNLPDAADNRVEKILSHSGKTDEDFMKKVVIPVNQLKGDFVPVSAFAGHEDGTFPQSTSSYEKRGIGINVPKWLPENCIQCNFCAYVCPHATVRPFLLNNEENAKKSEGFETIPATGKGFEDLHFTIQVSCLDCPGCTSCVKVCPGKGGNKALEMVPQESRHHTAPQWQEALAISAKEAPMSPETVKGSQFVQPLLEYSGACTGCGETPYARLVTQLFGDRMYIGNATGCSSIWGASAPSTPYTTNHKGHGPAWANSLFEDTAEFSLGFKLAVDARREKMELVLRDLIACEKGDACLKEAAQEWIDNKDCTKGSKEATEKIRKAVAACKCDGSCPCAPFIKHIKDNDDILVKKSIWAFGGDGWAYDIGFGGLDHILASGENVNILVFDTEVYSNTGGQSSKSTPTAATAKFAYSGKKIRKKDLGMMAMSYGHVYVAQVAMGYDRNQTIKALVEAEAYDGPSIVICYAPCIAMGIDMSNTQAKMKEAVEAGYWHTYRFDPRLEAEGKNPFQLDSKDPSADFEAFLKSETRYTALQRSFPDIADGLFAKAKEDAQWRYKQYKKLQQSQD